MFDIKRYDKNTDREAWNAFVALSKNGTFLFDRSYMDYHSDRFKDHSLMFYLNGKLYAVLPANINGDAIQSHMGLTYGGLVMGIDASAARIITLFQELNAYLAAQGIRHMLYKCVPWVYHLMPAEEDLYAIFRTCDAHLAARDIGTVIDMGHPLQWSYMRRRAFKRAVANGVTVKKSNNFADFWQILSENLSQKYGVKPVHSLQEIELLASRFPDNIALYCAYKDGRTVAGIVVYATEQVVHTQYIAANPEGKRWGAIDAICDCLLNQDYADCRYCYTLNTRSFTPFPIRTVRPIHTIFAEQAYCLCPADYPPILIKQAFYPPCKNTLLSEDTPLFANTRPIKIVFSILKSKICVI